MSRAGTTPTLATTNQSSPDHRHAGPEVTNELFANGQPAPADMQAAFDDIAAISLGGRTRMRIAESASVCHLIDLVTPRSR
jgi:hypothetical protein